MAAPGLTVKVYVRVRPVSVVVPAMSVFPAILSAAEAMPGDPVNDPSAAWPRDRWRVDVGTLEVSSLETGRETGGDVLVFDPTRVTDGIELSDDPVLRFRSAAYSASVARRMPK